jgi:hypothetical protein
MARTPQIRRLDEASARPADAQVRLRNLLSRKVEATGRPAARAPAIGPFLTISRQAGSGGAEVARRIGLRLGWAIYDRELVDSLARRLELAPSMLDLMDETRSNWFNDTLLNLLNSRLIFQDSYVSMIGKVMLLAVCDGRSVIVGRAGHLLLPADGGLRVRVIAPRRQRLNRLCAAESIGPEKGAARLEYLDRSRADFIQRHFHEHPDNPALYDMVVDTGSFGIDGAVELISTALRIRGLTAAD